MNDITDRQLILNLPKHNFRSFFEDGFEIENSRLDLATFILSKYKVFEL